MFPEIMFKLILTHCPVRKKNMGPGGEGWGPAFLFVSVYKNLHPDPVGETADATYGRLPRNAQPGGSAAGARRPSVRGKQATSVGYAHAPGGEVTMAGRAAHGD